MNFTWELILKKLRKIIEKEGKFYTARGAELTRASNTLTESEFFGRIISAIRRLTMYWKPKNDYLLTIRRPYSGTDKRIKWEYQCVNCLWWCKRTEIECDHIVPVGSFKCFNDAPGYLERAFAEKEGYQALCKECHLAKTNWQRSTK